MRVIKPEEFKKLNQPKKRKKAHKFMLDREKFFIVFVVIAVSVVGYFLLSDFVNKPPKDSNNTQQHNQQNEQPAQQFTTLKIFEPEEFKTIARQIKYPNTQLFSVKPSITGNEEADEIIRTIAEERGYVLSATPVSAIQKIDEPRLDSDDLLQPLAAESWVKLKTQAEKDRIPLSLLSGYRSPEYQRYIFNQRLNDRGATFTQIVRGQANAKIADTLKITAPPGYSRHHTGYTIDLWCEDGTGAFLNSKCYKWLSADNYKIAKETGWIPSYPDGVELQGPEPEPWEYVWAPKSLLFE